MSSSEDLRQRVGEKLAGVYRVAIRLCLVQCHGTSEERKSHGVSCKIGVIYDLCRGYGVPHQDLVTIALDEREQHSLTESARIERTRQLSLKMG